MRPSSPMFDPRSRPLPPITKRLLIAFVSLSILDAIARMWVGLPPPSEILGLEPGVALFQPWRLVTYPWLATNPLSLIIGGLMLFFFAGPLELEWGRRLFIRRLAVLVVLPALIVSVLALWVRPLQSLQIVGMSALITALITAFAGALRGRTIYLFPLPIALTGDMILYLQGGFIVLGVLFGGSIIPHLLDIASFGIALAWFRFGAGRSLRQRWLRLRKSRLEAKMARLRKKRPLRVVDGEGRDSESNSRRYLN